MQRFRHEAARRRPGQAPAGTAIASMHRPRAEAPRWPRIGTRSAHGCARHRPRPHAGPVSAPDRRIDAPGTPGPRSKARASSPTPRRRVRPAPKRYHPDMRHGVSAIRVARPRTTFVMPLGARERRLAAVGLLRLLPGSTGIAGDAARAQPLPALRSAARSAGIEVRSRPGARLTEPPAGLPVRWTSARSSLRRARRSGTGPWSA